MASRYPFGSQLEILLRRTFWSSSKSFLKREGRGGGGGGGLGEGLRSINVTFLVLIPKKLGVEDLKELVNKA